MKFIAFILFVLWISQVHGQERTGYYVNGRYLYDACGEEVILRGVNKMTTWTDRSGAAFPEIAKTGANCVRIVMVKSDQPSDLDRWVTQCTNNNMIPMPENHEATGSLDDVPSIVDWWCQPGMVTIIKKHEKHLLINIANEAGKWGQQSRVKSTYADAIVQMRDSGIHTPLVIDGSPWGQGADVLLDNYHYWNDLDPDHNILVSLHVYDGWMDADALISVLQQFVNKEIPVIIGEFSEYCLNGGCVPWETVLNECQAKDIGWLWWSWGPGNIGHPEMDMTRFPNPGLYSSIKGTGKIVAIDHPYSIRNTSLRPRSLMDSCGSNTIYRLSTDIIGGGTVLPALGRYHPSDTVILKATGSSGFIFSHWGGDLSGSDNPATLVMDTVKHVIANFTSIPTYTLTTNIIGNGTIVPESGTYNESDTVIVKATASSGYTFSYWSEDLSGTDNPDIIIMDEDKSVTATFVNNDSLTSHLAESIDFGAQSGFVMPVSSIGIFAYPNPASGFANIIFSIPGESTVSLRVYNVFGQEVLKLFEDRYPAGTIKTRIDLRNLSPGTYFYQLRVDGYNQTRKITLL